MNEKVDICDCFDLLFYPPKIVLDEWNKLNEPKKSEPFYGTELDGTTFFYVDNSRIKVSEHFNCRGKTIESGQMQK